MAKKKLTRKQRSINAAFDKKYGVTHRIQANVGYGKHGTEPPAQLNVPDKDLAAEWERKLR